MGTRIVPATLVATLAALSATLLRPESPALTDATTARTEAAAPSSAFDTPPDPNKPSGGETKEFPDGPYLIQRYLHSAIDPKEAPDAGQAPGVSIVTVPDPTDSHMDWAFDSYVESVRRAYEASGYTLDRFWLPWMEKTDTMLVQGGGARSRRVREEYPGVMLFRRASGTGPGLQLVYLVGEVPTAGVHKGALRRALNDHDKLLPGATTANDTVRIVGPSFSGSATSIAQVLSEWSRAVRRVGADGGARGRHDVVKVVSGAATLPDNVRTFGQAGPGVIYKATVNTDEVLTRVLLCSVLDKLRIRPEQVLLLHESGTAYGNAVEAGPRDQGVKALCRPGADSVSSSGFTRIPFPMNISSLRAEYEAHPAAAQRRAPGAAEPSAEERSRTTLKLSDPERPMERVPVTSGLTPPSLEVLMDQIEDAASRHDVQAVGIVATDVRDKLFLAEEMRSRLRNATFFTFEGNSLFLRPGKNAWYRGMLVLSTYPLTLENQWWTGRGGERRLLPFANEGAEGVYNALLVQLGRGDLATEYQRPFDDGISGGPPVWVSVVGSRAFLPLLFKPVGDSVHVQALPVRPTVTAGQEGLAFFTVLAMLLLALAVGYAAAWRPRTLDLPRPVADDVGSAALEERVRWGSQILHRHLYAFLRMLALLSMFIPATVLTYVEVSDARSVRGTVPWIAAALLLAIALATGLAFQQAAAVAARQRREDGAPDDAGAPAVLEKPTRLPLRPATGSVPWEVAAAVAVVLFTAVVAWILGRTIASASHQLLVAGLLCAWVAGAAGAAWHLAFATASAWRLRAAGNRYGAGLSPTGRTFWRGEVGARWGVLLAGSAYFVGSMVFTYSLFNSFSESLSFVIMRDRVALLDSGVSPLLLLVLAGVGFAAWCTWHLQRVELLRWSTPFEAAVHRLRVHLERRAARTKPAAAGNATDADTDADTDARGELAWRVGTVRTRLFMVFPTRGGALVLALLLTVAALLGARFRPTVESIVGLRWFEYLVALSVLGSMGGSVWAVYRLLAVWKALEGVLQTVAETPLLLAFRRLPVRATQLTRLTLWASSSRDLVKTLAEAQWRQLVTIYNAGGLGKKPGANVKPADQPEADKGSAFPPGLRGRVNRLMTSHEGPRRVQGSLDQHQEPRLVHLSLILRDLWRLEPDSTALGDVTSVLKDRGKVDTGTVFRDRFDTPQRLWLRAAEEFAAVQVVDYVEWVLQQMRTLALFIFATLIVTTALISSYPFQPQGEVKLVFTFLLIGTVASLLYVMVAMNRDEVLSHIADTDPGRVNWSWSFALNIGAVALVPVLTLVSSEVPGLHTALFSWIQPVLKALTHGG